MDNNSPRKKDLLDELKPYLEPKPEMANLTLDQYRRLYEWQEKRVSAYVMIIGELLGGMGAIVSHLQKDGVDRNILINVMNQILDDAEKGLQEVSNLTIQK